MPALHELEMFAIVVEAGSFAAAARKLRVTASATSRRIALLEQSLGVTLFARTTRSLRLTDDGQAFHVHCQRILEEWAAARGAIARVKRKPSGVLRVDVPVAFGRHVLVPELPAFLSRYPELRLIVTLRDLLVDPVAEGLDLAVRIGPLQDSQLIARRLGQSSFVYCAAPGYLRRHGTPRKVSDLARHQCVGYVAEGAPRPFRFQSQGGLSAVEIDGPCHINDADMNRQLVLRGIGVGCFFDFAVRAELARGELVPVLADETPTSWPLHALYPKNRHLLPKVSVFLEFLSELCRRAKLSLPRGKSSVSKKAG